MARSLRLRLLIGAAAAVFVAMLLAWVIMTVLFAHHIERRAAKELTYDAVELVARLRLDGGVPAVDDPPHDARFEKPDSGYYWQLTTKQGALRSHSLWDESLPAVDLDAARATESAEWATRFAPGPFGRRVFLLERSVRPDRSGDNVLVQVAIDEAQLSHVRREFGRELALFLALLWAALCGAAWVQVQLGLRPLQRIREELAALRRDPAARLSATHPHEIAPLTEAINDLAQARERDLTRARRRASDLAHSLKTPLAALSAQSRRARSAGAIEAADGLDRAIAAASAAVETELARSRAAAIRDATNTPESSPQRIAERVIGVVERTDAGARIVFEVDIDENLRAPLAEDDLTEILGALVENAVRFARRRVRIAGAREGGLALSVEDDGQGLDVSAETALMRGGRLDESGTAHHGLGLSIVRDLVEATAGEIELGRSRELGGLRVALTWPEVATIQR
ncbi:MAG: HAMP domain-containing histidine kinase [Rudaea sp.]|uniref:sensor histidine kinase n=1 Tax=unclassified Rudaea TaxID=2627037 RepID=UPI0010F93E57|nr:MULTISPECIES: HAMP domain-containing sensor histidine kinase [unclassified Rudaea]MBN8886152.1 HAMP domain-containing histidine kinase [Rudaea sp.]